MPKVLLTRPEERSRPTDEIHTLLRIAGVEILQLPMVRFTEPHDPRPLADSIKALQRGTFDTAIISSPTGVEFFRAKLAQLEIAANELDNVQFGVVGLATGAALERAGLKVRLPIPQQAGSAHLLAALEKAGLRIMNALLLQSQIGLDELHAGLSKLGIPATRVTLYETHGPSVADAARLLTLLENGSKPDVIAFFSPSSVHFFVRALAEMSSSALRGLPPLAAIGETTAKAIEESLRKRPEIVARKSDQQTLAEDILRFLQLPVHGN